MITYTLAETLLAINSVTLKYGDKMILNGVNATIRDIIREDVNQGQIVCFLGPSGIGKTQLARCIAGLQLPTSGSITVSQKMLPTKAGLVGFVQQSYPLFNYLTVSQNLTVASRLGGLSRKDSEIKIKGYFDVLGLSSSIMGSFPKQLSGGQRQRVAIIRQLLTSEHFLILDEPFSGLDIKAKAAACRLLMDVGQMDSLNTIIVITHDVTEGMSIADKVWLMDTTPAGGASIVDEFDLAAMGLAWQPDILDGPEFQKLVLDVKHRFLEGV